MTDTFLNYRALLERVDQHSQRISQAHADQLACRAGCTACCRQDLHVSRVEAEHILGWLGAHPLPPRDPAPTTVDDHPLFEALQNGQPCAFLAQGGHCAIYPVRPIICRTHGLPVLTPEDKLDSCPMNFTQGELPAGDALRLELLNQQLGLVDLLYQRQTQQPAARVPLSALRQMVEDAQRP